MQYRYVKKKPKTLPPLWLSIFLPVLLLAAGLSLIASGLAPIVYYQYFYSPGFGELVKPVPDDFLTTAPIAGNVLASNTSNLDSTKASNWFPTAPRPIPRPSKITHYNISIPKLKIQDAVVDVDGEYLKKSLVQYVGTALPGQLGNAVIFGHSALPQFFSPTNYTTIFATLPTLKVGDE
ncbi:MAG: sortase, partial [Candidatus Curtissbacteria bacterium]|nr:sortase [Candidatus Curtissbacteria bacterium]